MIRVASFNPILDPWVYILFRRELVWRLVKVCRCILRLEPLGPPQPPPALFKQPTLLKDPEGGGVVVNGEGEASEPDGRRALEDPYNPSCLAFCYQCLCLPPAPRRHNNMNSRGLSVTTGKFVPSPSMQKSRFPSRPGDVSPSGSSGYSPRRMSSRMASSVTTMPTSPSERLLLIKLTEGAGSSRSVNSVV